MATIETYHTPTSLDEAVRLLAAGQSTLLAGGTDLMPQSQAGMRLFEPRLINLRKITGLRGVTDRDGNVRIGALATVTDVLRNELLQDAAPILPAAADQFASDQVRNSATIGGNICNASPAGDMIIPFLLLDAEVELACWRDDALSTRRVPLCEFFAGPGQTTIDPDELLTAVVFAVPDARFVARFEKFGMRPALDIAVVSVGIGGVLDGGALTGARVAFGAVAPTPLRGRRTEAVIEGRAGDEAMIAEAVAQAAQEISPISDVRASAWYREELIRVLTGRVLRHVLQA